MRQLKIPSGVKWELLIVNNNCSDDTDTVIARHAVHLPIRRLFERTPGKPFAANLAISQAKGNLLLWTDDDVLVNPDWLVEYDKAAREWPDVMYFGGSVEPWFAVEPPKWISRHLVALNAVYAIRRIGSDPRPVDELEYPFGVNMAMKRQALDSISFDTRLGPRGNDRVHREDMELIGLFKQQGYQGRWVPKASLRHYIPAERLTYRYIWRWYVDESRTVQRLQDPEDVKSLLNVTLLFGAPRWMVRRYLRELARALLLYPFKSEQWLQAMETAAKTKGILLEASVQSRAIASNRRATVSDVAKASEFHHKATSAKGT
jgi:glycosyltransferase involved in cell wall biosynthesis